MAAMLEMPTEARRAWQAMPCGDAAASERTGTNTTWTQLDLSDERRSSTAVGLDLTLTFGFP